MRRVRRKGGNKEKVFGCDLLEHLEATRKDIPQVLQCCSEFVEQNGIVDGIYRLSGVSSNIQKLRGEFESDGIPDLNKDLYLQDIHCVSSLCKAYFRELPNPLLTYQLYDKFAEAVAIQLEEERLVKIRNVLKELPEQHHRTLEFLMRHLVRMASYSSETNMHARNLAIVWAPNLLRSKDIEASGFNGTAAFMEVRVQSIVVEFILTHVSQLFPEEGVSSERRKSLPSPSLMPNQDTLFQRSAQPNFGNISPGDGPLPIRPYHAIIEGTDKRKGSLKGRKWMSIFNIGGRFQDPRRRHKHSSKEKERPALRPARSMDSLSTPSYPNEGSGRPALHPPSNNTSSVVPSSPKSGSEMTISTGGIGGSEYAVTYRRGTGLVSGGAGTQGTYTALDPDSLGIAGCETVQTRSPGLTSKAGRRAAMHITGPTIVTVPLHITSNLALGVLQGGGSDRLIHRGRDKDGGDKAEAKEAGEKVERKEDRGMEGKVEEGGKAEEEKNNNGEKEDVNMEWNNEEAAGEKMLEGTDKEGDGEMRGHSRPKEEPVMGGQGVFREQRAKSHNSSTGGDNDQDAKDEDQDANNSEYMEMKGTKQDDHPPAMEAQHGNESAFDASNILNSTEVEGDDPELSGYVQDNFEFLDQMDCSVLDHMENSMSYQVNEFSVEPPGHSDDEYEIMAQAQQPAGLQTHVQPDPDCQTPSQTELSPRRPLSLDLHSRHTKSLSLPYITSPIQGPEDSCSEDEVSQDDSYPNDYSSDEDESMFIQSLPPDFFLNTLSGIGRDTDTQDRSHPDQGLLQELQSTEDKNCQSPDLQLPAYKETATGDEEQGDTEGGEDEDGLEDKDFMRQKDAQGHDGKDQLENNMQRGERAEELSITEDDQSATSPTLEPTALSTVEVQALSSEDKDDVSTDCPPHCPMQKETVDTSFEEVRDTSVTPEAHPFGCVKGPATQREDEDAFQQSFPEAKNSCENRCDGVKETDLKRTAEKENEVEDGVICRANPDIWNELEDVICEVIEDEESEQFEREDVIKDGMEEKQPASPAGEFMVEASDFKTNVREEEEGGLSTNVQQFTNSETCQDSEEYETDSPMTSELERRCQEKCASREEEQHHNGAEEISRETEKEKSDKEKANEQSRTQASGDNQVPAIRSDVKEVREGKKLENSDSTLGEVGRKLVISKHPKVYQVKAVPVVPPKPQHCKAAARHLRQQQQRELREAETGRDNVRSVPSEQDKISAGEQVEDGDDESTQRKERPSPLREKERRKDGAEGALTMRDASRNSPLSMCFDEAVAIATMRREKERVREGEADVEGLKK